MKGSIDPEVLAPSILALHADVCARTRARAHARSGDPIAIASYLAANKFDRSVTDFSERYADRNEQDYKEFIAAIRSGRLEAREGL